MSAEKQRKIKSFADLDNLICVAEITINDKGDQPRNEIKTILTPDHAKYNDYINERSGKIEINYKQVSNKQAEDVLVEDALPF